MKHDSRHAPQAEVRALSPPDPRLRWLCAALALAGLWALTAAGSPAADEAATDRGPAIDHQVVTIDGRTIGLDRFRGKAMLIVNTASKCGYTPQYEGLQTLYERFRDRGLVVVGFPSNDFGNQEPGSEAEIATFCKRNYGVSFPMMAKVHTRGESKAPLYRALTESTPEPIRGEIRWNFTKFLVDPEGYVVARFEPAARPLSDDVLRAVEGALPAKTD
jgi:glutathione peroxidase